LTGSSEKADPLSLQKNVCLSVLRRKGSAPPRVLRSTSRTKLIRPTTDKVYPNGTILRTQGWNSSGEGEANGHIDGETVKRAHFGGFKSEGTYDDPARKKRQR